MPDNNCQDLNDCFYGSATIGDRGQVVIPAEARAELDISSGDKVLFMRHPAMKGLMVAKFEDIRGFLDIMQERVSQVEAEDEERE